MADGMSDFALNIGATAIAAEFTHLQLHSGDPGVDGTANVVSGPARGAVTFNVAANGNLTLSVAEAFTGITPSAAVTHATLWDALTVGNFGGTKTLTGDQAANSAGEYDVGSFVWTAQTS